MSTPIIVRDVEQDNRQDNQQDNQPDDRSVERTVDKRADIIEIIDAVLAEDLDFLQRVL